MEPDESKALIDLHHNRWTELLVSALFIYIHDYVLTKQERIVTGLKIEYYEDGVNEVKANQLIANLLHLKVGSIERLLYNIKNKYRHHMDTRVDNKQHPEIWRAIKRRNKKQHANQNPKSN